MKTVIINGGKRLCGDITVSGSKNAALPMIFASLITRGITRIRRLPDIGDVRVALGIISSLGARVWRKGDTTLIDTQHLTYTEDYVCPSQYIRASTYLLGACLSHFGECRICDFGGCNFSDRPIDMHIAACVAFGGEVVCDRVRAKCLRGADIRFEKRSVGATVNALILAAGAVGESNIFGYASEPHVRALADFLISAGADITFTEEKIKVQGKRLHGADITVIGDMIEAGTYLTAGLITGGRVTVHGCCTEELSAYLDAIEKTGAEVIVNEDAVTAQMRGNTAPTQIIAEAYPGFPTDLQPIIAPYLAVSSGGKIKDNVWCKRYGYLQALAPFGLKYEMREGGVIIIPSSFHNANTHAPDLRGGAAALLCALAAVGESRIECAEHILRGYECLDTKMRKLGVDIKITESAL